MRCAARERSMKNLAMTARTKSGMKRTTSAAPRPIFFRSPLTLRRICSRTSGGRSVTVMDAPGGGTGGSTPGTGGTGGTGGMPLVPLPVSSTSMVMPLPFPGGLICTRAFSPAPDLETSMSRSGLDLSTPRPITMRLRSSPGLAPLSAAFFASSSAWRAALRDWSSARFTLPSSRPASLSACSALRRASSMAETAPCAASRAASAASRLAASASRPASRSSLLALSSSSMARSNSSRRASSFVALRMVMIALLATSSAPSAKVLSISRLIARFSSGVAPTLPYWMRWKGVTRIASDTRMTKPPRMRPHQGVRWMNSESGFMGVAAAPREDTRKHRSGQ